MIHIQTPRLTLRNYREHDLDDYFEYMSLEETALHEDFYQLTMDQCEAAILSRLGDDTFWAVELDGKMIGDLCYRPGDDGTYEIAYDFNPKFSKCGYATEACRALIDHIFNEVGGRRLYVGCNEGNENSWRLLERLGFRREAHCIEDISFKKDADGNPIYVNSYFYAMLKREWPKG